MEKDIKKYGVFYNKDPMMLFKLARGQKRNPKDYIFLTRENSKDWNKLLKDKQIDPEKIVGVTIDMLRQYGAIIEGGPEPFSPEEILYGMIRRQNEQQFENILIELRGEFSTSLYFQFRKDKTRMYDYLYKKLRDNKNGLRKKKKD